MMEKQRSLRERSGRRGERREKENGKGKSYFSRGVASTHQKTEPSSEYSYFTYSKNNSGSSTRGR